MSQKYKVRKNHGPCPDTTKYFKTCCEGTEKRHTVEWRCCDEEEPPCKCCDSCDLNNCPPHKRMAFAFRIPNQVPDFREYLIKFSQIVKRHSGYTCCEEFLIQNPNGGGAPCFPNITVEGYVSVCIEPAATTIQDIINDAQANGFINVNLMDNLPNGCGCLGK